jgi:hypothetical protein
MRDDNFEVQVVNAAGAPYPERDVNGLPCFIAVAGQEFRVKLTVHNAKLIKLIKSDCFSVSLKVDGRSVGYHEVLKPKHAVKCAVFKGFREKDRDLRAFKFSEPTLSDQQSTADAGSSVGIISVTIRRRQPTGGTKTRKPGCHEAPQNATLQEAKKFWQQPSLETEAGRKLSNQVIISSKEYKTISTYPSLELRYHTSQMADILDGINAPPTYPAPPAMPAMGLSAAIGAEDTGDGTGDGEAGVGGDESGGAAGAASGRKRRRTGGSSGNTNGTLNEPVDLTGPYAYAATHTGPAISVDLTDVKAEVKAEAEGSLGVGAGVGASSSSSST